MEFRRAGGLAALFIAACGLLMPISEASAHTELVSTVPSSGAVLDAAPVAVVLTFNEDLLAASAEASILDGSGDLVATSDATVDGSVVTVPWPAGLDAGAYEVAYRVASGDGHPVTGTVPFSYTGPTVPASPSARVTEPAATSPTELAAAPTVAPAAEPSPAPASMPGGTAPNPFIIGALLVAAALIGGFIVVRRGRQ